MALSRLAAEFAAEIQNHDWSDAPYRADRAGHDRAIDTKAHNTPVLGAEETAAVRTNVMWVVAQVLGHADPNFDPKEFAEACDVFLSPGVIYAGLRIDGNRQYAQPGTWEFGDDENIDEDVVLPVE